jgi:hypothetical protein
MSANAIWFEETEQRFYFDGIAVSTEKLGRVIANSLVFGTDHSLRGEYVELGGVTVTVNYLTEMLRWTGKYGWFYDITDNTSDHDFDTNQITPGSKWGEYQEFLELARKAEAKASDKRRSRRTAAELRQSASEYRNYATEALGLYRNMRRMAVRRNAR